MPESGCIIAVLIEKCRKLSCFNMASQRAWDYLLNAVKKPKEPERFKALSEWFFKDLTIEGGIEHCAEIAYTDLTQSPLAGIGGMPEKEKEDWRHDIERLISLCIKDLLICNLSQQSDFDEWHQKTCEEIRQVSDAHRVHERVTWMKEMKVGFTYGLAQKWLNMTLKNMLVAETAEWFKRLNRIKHLLHVPVDQYVLQEAYQMLGIRDGGKNKKFKPDAWSKWNDYDSYIRFQDRVRKAIEDRDDYDCPIDWEFDAWIAAKEK